MKLKMLLLLGLSAGIFSSCQKETDLLLDEEAQMLNEESALKSAMPDTHFNLGQIYLFTKNDPQQALMHFSKALHYRPDFAEAITRYQNLYTALQANLMTGSQLTNVSLLDFLK